MPGLAAREFECTLCQQRFTLLAGDLMLPGPSICDDCLIDTWDLEDGALIRHVAQRLADEEVTVGSVVQHIERLREQWSSAAAAIEDRERGREAAP